LKAGDGWGGPIGFNHNQTAVRSSEGLRVKSSVRAGHIGGSLGYNHNQTTVRAVRVKSTVKAGGIFNHNQTAVRSNEGLRVKTSVKAGRGDGEPKNHNQTAMRAVRVKSSVKAGFERPMSWDNVKNQHNQTVVRAGR